MKIKNFKLAQAIFESGHPQFKIAEMAGVSSEARLSRIIGYRVNPTAEEVKRLSEVLSKTPDQLGLLELVAEIPGINELGLKIRRPARKTESLRKGK